MVSKQSQEETESRPNIGRIPALIAAVAIVGIAIGAAAGLLTLMLYQVERFALGYIENAHESGPFNVPAIRRAISVTVGASIAAVMWWLLRTRTTEVPSVKKAVGGAIMPVWQTIVHVLLQISSSYRHVDRPRSGASRTWRDVRPTIRPLGASRREGHAYAGGHYRRGRSRGSLQRAACRHVLRGGDPARRRDTRDGHARVRMLGARLMGGEPGQGHAHVLFDWRAADGSLPRYMVFALVAGLMLGAAGALFRRGSQWAEKNKPSGAAFCG